MRTKHATLFSTIIISIFLALFSVCSFASDNTPYNKIVFFGDSLSDNGNLYSLLFKYLPKSPPYYEGRFSNGPVWSDLIGDYFKGDHIIQTWNFAVGGQTTILHNPSGGFLPYTLMMSIDDYLVRTLFRDRTTTLFVIWVGANDYLQGSLTPEQLSSEVTEKIKYAAESLINAGGKNLMIINIPNLSKAPISRARNMEEIHNLLSTQHNQKLTRVIAELQSLYDNVNIHLFDVDQLITNFFADPEKYNKKYKIHISELNQSCWSGGYSLSKSNPERIRIDLEKYLEEQLIKRNSAVSFEKFNVNEAAQYISHSPALLEAFDVSKRASEGALPCPNADDYFFWDQLHPTGVVHRLLSYGIFDFIEQNYHYAYEPSSVGLRVSKSN